MPLDYTIPLKAQATQNNPLQMALQAAQYRYMNQNTNQLQQQMGANQAVSEAIQRNTGSDGKVDLNAVQYDLSKDPRAAYDLQASTGTNMQQQGQQTLNSGNSLKLQQEQLGALTQQLGTLMNKPDLSRDDVVGAATSMGKSFGLPANVIAQSVAGIPNDPSQLKPYLASKIASLQAPGDQLNSMTPGGGSVDTGPNVAITNTRLATGIPIGAPVTVYNKGLTPEFAATQTPVVNPDGTPGVRSNASILHQQGYDSVLPSGFKGGGAAPGRYGASTGGVVPTGPAAGVVDANKAVNVAGGNDLAADMQSNSQSGTRINMLQNAQTALQNAQTGTGADKLNAVRGLIATLGGPADKVASYDEANKYLTQYAQNKAATFGHGTDSQLAAAIAGNGNTHISNLAAQDVVKVNLGLERMEQARMQAWQNSGLPPSQYAQWKSQFGSTMDPRVFIADQMDPSKVQAMVKNMNPKQQATFRAQYNWAVQNGYINGPQ